jgi:hypothetical protein
MSLVLQLIGFVLFLSIFSSGLIWGAMLAGVPGIYIVAGSLIVFAIGLGIFRTPDHSHNQASAD